jgi:hypothetical protein
MTKLISSEGFDDFEVGIIELKLKDMNLSLESLERSLMK